MRYFLSLLVAALLSLSAPVQAAEQVIFPSFGALYGVGPQGLVADPLGNLYGATTYGGNKTCDQNYYCGLVYKLTPPSGKTTTWKSTVLYKFMGGTDGSVPVGRVTIGSDGALYGVTVRGGGACPGMFAEGCGTIFRLNPPSAGQSAWTETIVFTFTGFSTGFHPAGGVTSDRQGALYGATTEGGDCPNNTVRGCGLIYKLTPPGANTNTWTQTVLHSFTDGIDGRSPIGDLVFDDVGTLYGSTSGGGSSYPDIPHYSTLFTLVPNTKATSYRERILYRVRTTAAQFAGPLLVDRPNGTIYGTTFQGPDSNSCFSVATYGCGTVFKLAFAPTGAGTLSVLHMYNNASGDGDRPVSGVIALPNGVLYGTTGYGGRSIGTSNCCGTVFALTPPASGQSAWTNVTLHAFTNTPDGNYPSGGLIVQGGSLYGTTTGGGTSGNGSAFKVDP